MKIKKRVIQIDDFLINVDEKKKIKIINSAMKEFSENTFQKASTNKIVEEAGISKGLLFHYFGSKTTLYKYLECFSIKIIADKIMDELDWQQKDIFTRLKEISMIKFKVFEQYPYMADFSLKVFQDKTLEEIMKIHPDFPRELYTQIYSYNIDYSLFKKNIDIKKAINITQWTIEKYGETVRRSLKDGNRKFDDKEIEEEIYAYIDMLKECFYKEK